MATALEFQHFAVLEVLYLHKTTSIIITSTTNNPSHLTLYYTDKEPVRHATTLVKRGVALPWGAYFCFVAWKSVEQEEAGDTLTHTFEVPGWSYCQTKWICFRGTVAGQLSPSVSALIKHHHPGPSPLIEEQTQYDEATGYLILGSGDFNRAGQRLTISNRTVTKLGFWLRKYGTPPGSYHYVIRKVSDDSMIVDEVVATADSLTTTITYKEHTFASPPTVNEEVRILVEYMGGDAANMITTYREVSDVKADEYFIYHSTVYTGFVANDQAYKYTYFPY